MALDLLTGFSLEASQNFVYRESQIRLLYFAGVLLGNMKRFFFKLPGDLKCCEQMSDSQTDLVIIIV